MSSDSLSATFAALADPTRRAILGRLITGETSVTKLAEPFQMSLPAISKHLKVLERAGLIARGREAQWRPSRLEVGRLKEVADWLEDAPRELVWQAWTDPKQLVKWWGPKNFTAPVAKIDLRVGGKYLYCMRSPEGQDYWSTGTYREVVPPERLVCTDSFADADGNVVPGSHYGLGEDFPLEMQVTITFEDVAGKTKMTLQHVGLPESMSDMTGTGWNESFDKLAESLK